MKHFIIITNRPKDPDLEITRRVQELLKLRQASCSVYADEIPKEEWKRILLREGDRTDAILVLGGDGTMLRAARDTADSQIPMLGINLGTLSYQVEDRMMLCGQIYRQGRMEEENSALNDITITRCGHLRMLYFQIYVNGKLLKEYHADGIIIATPTGSTGYNMSAGGPLVEPGAQMILLTPVCPHTLQTRSIVLRAADEIIIRIIGKAGREETGIEACFDGARNVELAPLDEVRVTKSIKTTSIIKISEAGFLDVLHRKMSD